MNQILRKTSLYLSHIRIENIYPDKLVDILKQLAIADVFDSPLHEFLRQNNKILNMDIEQRTALKLYNIYEYFKVAK